MFTTFIYVKVYKLQSSVTAIVTHMVKKPPCLVLLRHGQSQWNLDNRFTGWFDIDLTKQGVAEAKKAGHSLKAAGIQPDIVHTSLQTRAILTANLALAECNRLWIPVHRTWRLNERHYGALTGLNKDETSEKFGVDQVRKWRRSYATPPPLMEDDHPHNPNTDQRYRSVPNDLLPRGECLADVVERLVPFWDEALVRDLHDNEVVLIAAHGNSLRALVKHLENIDDEQIVDVEIPTGVPIVYELDSDFNPLKSIPLVERFLS